MENKNKKKNMAIIIMGIITIILVILLGLKSCESDKPVAITGGGEDPAPKVTEVTTINDMIQFPTFYGTYRLEENNPYITLTNPEENDVMMKFTYTLNGETLCTSDWIMPSKSYNGNVYELLPEGTYTILMAVETLDIATGIPCTAMDAKADVIIKK